MTGLIEAPITLSQVAQEGKPHQGSQRMGRIPILQARSPRAAILATCITGRGNWCTKKVSPRKSGLNRAKPSNDFQLERPGDGENLGTATASPSTRAHNGTYYGDSQQLNTRTDVV